MTVMVYLALVLELHHPLPPPGQGAGPDWTAAAADLYWPALKAIAEFAERDTGGSLTLAVSPGWRTLAADPAGAAPLVEALDQKRRHGARAESLYDFAVERWGGDAVSLLSTLGRSGAVDLIPMTSTHTWLPSVAVDAVAARAQIRLAAADHHRCLGRPPSGLWLPYLAYLPGLENVMAESRLRYFGVTAADFLRGTVKPPDGPLAPLVTPPGVAAFAVDSAPFSLVKHPEGYGRDPRYLDPATAGHAAVDHARHALQRWTATATAGHPTRRSREPIAAASISIHDLAAGWAGGRGADWLAAFLEALACAEGVAAVSLGHYLDRHPSGPLGRPGPSGGGFLAARPRDSDLFDWCRSAAEFLGFFVERRRQLDPPERRTVAHLTRCLLRAQQIDWALPPGSSIEPDVGLRRSRAHLDRFHELAGLLLAGRSDPRLLDDLDRQPPFLPEIDLDLLADG